MVGHTFPPIGQCTRWKCSFVSLVGYAAAPVGKPSSRPSQNTVRFGAAAKPAFQQPALVLFRRFFLMRVLTLFAHRSLGSPCLSETSVSVALLFKLGFADPLPHLVSQHLRLHCAPNTTLYPPHPSGIGPGVEESGSVVERSMLAPPVGPSVAVGSAAMCTRLVRLRSTKLHHFGVSNPLNECESERKANVANCRGPLT